MEAVAKESFKDLRRRKLSNGHVVARLLEAPLPTPRRSCCGSSSSAPDAPPVPRRVSAADASPQRRHVPFSWESSPGVPKTVAVMVMGGKGRVVPPPPGRCGAGAPCRASYHENTTTTDGSSEDDGGDTFSDALDRTSSSDRLALAALSARLSSVDGAGVAGSRRSPSFIMDRFLPAANAIATTSADKPHPRRSSSPRRRSVPRSNHDDDEAVARARRVMMNAPRSCAPAREQPKRQQSPPRVNREEQGDDKTSSARACGLMFFFPWRAKPVLLGFPLTSPRTNRTSNASAASVTAPSPPRRSMTLGDVLEKERGLRDGDNLLCWHEEKIGSGKEWARLGWGAGILGTSKRYCADARKALSRLARSATDGGGSPRLCRERRSGKRQTSESDVIPPLSPPSESWLSHARRSNAGSNKR